MSPTFCIYFKSANTAEAEKMPRSASTLIPKSRFTEIPAINGLMTCRGQIYDLLYCLIFVDIPKLLVLPTQYLDKLATFSEQIVNYRQDDFCAKIDNPVTPQNSTL